MLARAICVVALAGCFTPPKGASKPKYVVYNALMIVGGAVAGVLGYEAYEGLRDTDGLGPYIGAMAVSGGIGGGAFMAIGGIAGIALTSADYEPTH